MCIRQEFVATPTPDSASASVSTAASGPGDRAGDAQDPRTITRTVRLGKLVIIPSMSLGHHVQKVRTIAAEASRQHGAQ